MPQAEIDKKSFERFISDHYMMLYLSGPLLIVAIGAALYLHYLSKQLKQMCQCSKGRGPCRILPCFGQGEKSEPKRVKKASETVDERSSKIQNRKQTPAAKRKPSRSPRKQRAAKGERSPSPKRASTSPIRKRGKKLLEDKNE